MPEQQYAVFDIDLWQGIATRLLRKYTEKFYRYHQNKWEAPHREYVTLTKDDANFIREYQVIVNKQREGVINSLREIEQALIKKEIPDIRQFGQSKALIFDKHLYQPLLCKQDDKIQIKPVALNDGEKKLVEDLQDFCENADKENDKREIYLLRNMSRGKGVGFFEAGNFYPDFILWVLDGGKQYINFIDPKGLHHISNDNPKIKFHETIKEIEKDMGNANIILDSFIVSVTAYDDLIATYEPEDLAHILFQKDDSNYIDKIFANKE